MEKIMSQTILVADDHKKTVQLITLYLEKDGYRVLAAYDGRQAIDLAHEQHPDLLVLDLMLPQVDGLDVCRSLRAESKVPVIMLTAKTTEEDILLGLGLGADDYITKPFSPRELVARIRAVLRRVRDEEKEAAVLQFDGLIIDTRRHEVLVNGQPVHLTPKEFRLLKTLAADPGRVLTRAELVGAAFGLAYEGTDRTVDGHIMNLRKKIEPTLESTQYIETVFGVGYRFIDDAS